MRSHELLTAWQPPDHWCASTAILECKVSAEAGVSVRAIYREYVNAMRWIEDAGGDPKLLAEVRRVVEEVGKLLD